MIEERCRLRNITPFPIDDDLVGRGMDTLNGSKSSSRMNCPHFLAHTSSSLKPRYSEIVNSSTLSSYTLTRTNSQTPGLGRIAKATKGGSTMASCRFQDFTEGTITELHTCSFIAANVVKLVDQAVRLQYPLPLCHKSSKKSNEFISVS
nr:hypothetical protein Iba_chr12cCG17850 [Ipomoea batatas]